MRSQNQTIERNLESTQQSLLDAKQLANCQKTKIEDLDQINQNLVKDLTEKNQLVENLNNQIQIAKGNFESTKQRLSDSQEFSNSQKAKINDLDKKVQNLTKDLAKKDKLVEVLESTQNQQKFEIESLKGQNQSVEKSLQKFQNCFPRLQKFLKEPVDAKDDSGMTKLCIASRDGVIEDVEILLMLGADVNAKNHDQMTPDQETPLHLAARYGHSEIAKLLVQNGADVDAKNNNQKTPLHLAAENGPSEIAELLLQSGADVNAKNKYQDTPLHLAASNGNFEIVKLLLQNGANVNAKNKWQDTPLHWAAVQGYPEVVEFLFKHGARNHLNKWNQTPLQMAENYKRGEFTKVTALLKQN